MANVDREYDAVVWKEGEYHNISGGYFEEPQFELVPVAEDPGEGVALQENHFIGVY